MVIADVARVDPIGERAEPTEEERDYYSLSRRVYRVLAPFYDAVALPLRSVRGEVADRAGIDRSSRVLDVATGTGAQALAFAAKGADVVGVDLSESMLRVARRRNRAPNPTFQEADATNLPFENGTFDLSCVSFALHEMPRSIRERTLREMARVTKPNGTILVVDFGLPKNRLGAFVVFHAIQLYEPDDYADFVRSDLKALLDGVGLDLRDDQSALHGVARIVRASNTGEGTQSTAPNAGFG